MQQPDQFGDRIVDHIQRTALGIIELFYEENPERARRRPYHDRRHTQRVIARAEQILQAIQAVAPDIIKPLHVHLLRTAAPCHDLVQHAGKNNEQESFGCARHLLEVLRSVSGSINIGSGEMDVLHEAFMATVAEFNAELGTAIQPNLTTRSHPVARILALADLGCAGMDGPPHIIEDGNRMFREMNGFIDDMLADGALDDVQVASIKGRMVAWSEAQVKFIAGRQSRLDDELDGLPAPAHGAVRQLFCTFEQSLAEASRTAEVRRTMDFSQLLVSFGYPTIAKA